MKETRADIMGMPITVDIAEPFATEEDLEQVFDYFRSIDERFSPFKETSEVSRINKGELAESQYSAEMKTVLKLAEETKEETGGYFDIYRNKRLNPSGIVKGWAIWQAAQRLRLLGMSNFYINAGGDVQANGRNSFGAPWRIGVANPFKEEEIVKVVFLSDKGIATSGTYRRGQHIYNPHKPQESIKEIVSLTVIGPDVFEADRFATAAFAMGRKGIDFIEKQAGLEAYMIDKDKVATYTSGFKQYEQ